MSVVDLPASPNGVKRQTAQIGAATSNAAPNNGAPSTISGTPEVGQPLTANDGS